MIFYVIISLLLQQNVFLVVKIPSYSLNRTTHKDIDLIQSEERLKDFFISSTAEFSKEFSALLIVLSSEW